MLYIDMTITNSDSEYISSLTNETSLSIIRRFFTYDLWEWKL